jgi:hypothetical protein
MRFASYPSILASRFIHFTYWSNKQNSGMKREASASVAVVQVTMNYTSLKTRKLIATKKWFHIENNK